MQLKLINIYVLSMILAICCQNTPAQNRDKIEKSVRVSTDIIVGADRQDDYISLLQNKNVALVVNQSSVSKGQHILDILLSRNIRVKRIFAPEHGFRGEADAGAVIKDGKDAKTGIPIVSLYGSKKKPESNDLEDIDMIVYDIQDVGVRYYTYISTLHYVMESCAENSIELMILDRPNPNGFYIDGPVLDTAFRSFVGMHPVPVVHGMTTAEYARMIQGEGWINESKNLKLSWVICENYDHNVSYDLPVKPSPNLPNLRSVLLYPGICLFEGTVVSLGRGTEKQFQILGHPSVKGKSFSFTPKPNKGASDPPQKGKLCFGDDLSTIPTEEFLKNPGIRLGYLIEYHKLLSAEPIYFLKNNFIDKLAGGSELRLQILAGKNETEIKRSWEKGLVEFQQKRKKYLLYPDFQ